MCKCSTCKVMAVQDCCFCAEQNDGTNTYGCCFGTNSPMCCTKNKDVLSEEENTAYDVVIPPVENICLRSACCIGYCGFSCKAEDRPLGCTREQTCMCCQQQNGCQVLTGTVAKRAILSFVQLQSLLNCETPGTSEFVVTENSCKGLCCCCVECGNAAKASCCPTPITCCGTQGQCCCLFYRANFPCDSFAPCELGCCSVMCMDKVETIKEAEAKVRERSSKGAIEATIVEKGGAPVLAEEMDR